MTPKLADEVPCELESFSTEDLVEASKDVDLEEEAPVCGFVVAITSSRLRRLHFVGNCGKIPGVHYRSYEAFDNEVPDATKYDRRCRSCFPEYFKRDASGPAEDEDSSGSSTHSSE